jgi:hypothetical protein
MEMLGQRLDIAGEIAPSRRTRAAAMDQNQGMAFARFVIAQLPVFRLDVAGCLFLCECHDLSFP